MFERFGLMDIFSAVKRCGKTLLVILAAVIVLVGGYNLLSMTSLFYGNSFFSEGKTFVSSATYMVTAESSQEPAGEEKESLMSTSKALVNQLISMTQTDFCKQYVLDYMLDSYTQEELLHSMGKSSGTPLTIHLLPEYFTASNVDDSMMLNIFVKASDEVFAGDLLTAYSSFLTDYCGALMPFAHLQYAGGVDQVLSSAPQDGINLLKDSVKQTIRQELIAVGSTAAILLIAVFFVALFHPTMNRREDFLAYNLPFLGELPGRQKCRKEAGQNSRNGSGTEGGRAI